ncbi:TonB-dependent receptor [Asticcacaulis sp. W401b]|uniref:TonB-dependent receptor n=1 Tax=Asticcacaulis sp. W401b TaxID=3388666 RepID=UPI003970BD80
MKCFWAGPLAAGLAFGCAPAFGHDGTAHIEDGSLDATEVYVFGKRRNLIGQAASASEGVISFARFADRPLLRPGELVEAVPGMAATQHSGNTKANQFFLRGFNLDHGTDFSVSLDGAPLNLRSHGHGQGYLDLNSLIPEVVETIRYRKGPYYADVGDFSSAGTAAFRTLGGHASSYLQATVGENGYGRFLGVTNLGHGGFAAIDLTGYRGGYDNPDHLKKAAFIARVDLDGIGLSGWSLTGLAHDASSRASNQIPLRAVEGRQITRLGAIDTSDYGDTSRFILSLQRRGADGLEATAYLQSYRLDLYSNFTYALRDPENGDQFQQVDERWIYGGSIVQTWPTLVAGFTIRTGAEARYDDIGRLGLYYTRERQRLSTVREDRLREYSAAVFSEASRTFGPVRITAGLRFDTIGGMVRSDDPRNSGDASDSLWSPKLTAAWRVSDRLELYADAGRGFHSNDLRGATVSVTPGTDDPTEAVELLAPSEGAEVGLRYSLGRFSATAALWQLHLDSELVYIGDEGHTEASGATKRQGVEVLLDYTPRSGLNLNLTAAASRARFAGNPEGGSRIPNALDYVVTAGVTARLMPQLTGTLTARVLSPSSLVEDNSVRSKATTLVNGLLTQDFGRFKLRLEVLNLLDSHDDDIRYYYESRLPGEADEGVADVHFHSFEPRTVRLTLRIPLNHG